MKKTGSDEDNETTHFGYQTVDKSTKAEKVAAVFHSVATKYDLMNDLASMGIHRIWKHCTLEKSGVKKGQKVLDLAGGTGDLVVGFSRLVGEEGQVILADINDSMLEVGRQKLQDKGIVGNVDYVRADGEALPFASNYFDCVSIAFGLRNITDKVRALHAMFRVLKPGGRLLVLEFSTPKHALFRKAYDLYSFHVLPKIGKLVTKDEESYRYLAESIRVHPDQEALKLIMEEVGFVNVTYRNMTDGVVALHCGYKDDLSDQPQP